MPLKNSPTNEPGKLEKTMWNEYIVIADLPVSQTAILLGNA